MSDISAEMIYTCIPRVMAEIGSVAKDQKNSQQNYMFRGIEAFYQAAHPALIKHGVFCAPEVLEREAYRFEKTNFDGKLTTWLHVTLKVRHRFFCEDGSYIDVVTCGEGLDNSDKATNKAMSGAMKYALIELFCVPTKDIEDSDRTTPEAGVQKTTEQSVAFVKPALAKMPDVQSATENPFAEKTISVKQAGDLAQRFRESLREELKPMAETLRHDFLTFKKFIDKDGNPSSMMIPVSQYVTIGKQAIEYARNL